MNLSPPIKELLEKYRYQLLLLLACAFGYFPITSFILIPKWDNINAFLPYRHIVSTWINNGHLALWNPYQLLGYPMHSDPQSGAWYPITWIIGWFNNYDFYAINIELSFHFFIGGLGMFLLARSLKLRDNIAFLMGLSYMFSGFMVGTAQVLVLIIAAAWFPLSINYLLRSLQNPNYKNVFLLALINFLLVTGSYPAMTLILFYFYLIIAFYYLYRSYKGVYSFKRLLLVYSSITGLTLLLSGAYFISIFEVLSEMTRAEAIPYTADLFEKVSFNVQCFVSFILPYATTANTEFFNTDLSMANGYFGVFGLLIMLAALIYSRDRKIFLLFGSGLAFLLLSTGMQLPIHFLFYKFVPGFDLFRHPSIFRLYAIFFFIIAAGFSIQYFVDHPEKNREVKGFLKLSIYFFIGLVFIGLLKTNYTLLDDYFEVLINYGEKSPFNLAGHILIQSLLQLVLLSVAYFSLKKGRLNMKRITLLVFVDLFLACQLNAPRTLYYNIPFIEFQNYYTAMPQGINNQGLNDNIGEINNKSVKPKQRGLYNNLNSFAKRTAYDGYNPFKFKDFIMLRESGLMPGFLDNGLFYLADSLLETRTVMNPPKDLAFAYIDKMQFKNDIDFNAAEGTLSDLNIDYNSYSIHAELSQGGYVFINQNHNKNWKASVDGESTSLIKSNISLMGVFVPSGKHELSLEYSSQNVEVAFVLSMITFFLGLIILAYKGIKQKEP